MKERKLKRGSSDSESSSDDFTDTTKYFSRASQPKPTTKPDVILHGWYFYLYPKVHFYYGPMINGLAAKPASKRTQSSKNTSARSPSFKSFTSAKHTETYGSFYSQGGKVQWDRKYEVSFTYWQIFQFCLILLPVFYAFYLQIDYRRAVAEHRIPILCQSSFFSNSGICTKLGFGNPAYEQLVLVSNEERDKDLDKKKPIVAVRVEKEKKKPHQLRGPPVEGRQKTRESYITARKRASTVSEDERISTPREDEYTKIKVALETIQISEDTEPLGSFKPLEAVKQAFSFFNTLTELKYLSAKRSIFRIQLSKEPPTLQHILAKADITTQNNLPIQAAWQKTLSFLLMNLDNQLTCHLDLGIFKSPSTQHLSLLTLSAILRNRFYFPWTHGPEREIRKVFTRIADQLGRDMAACPSSESVSAGVNSLENILSLLVGETETLAPKQMARLGDWKFWKTRLLLHGRGKYDLKALKTWQLARYFEVLEEVKRGQAEIDGKVKQVVEALEAFDGKLEEVGLFGVERGGKVKVRVREYLGLVKELYGNLERMTEQAEGVAKDVRDSAEDEVYWG